MKRSDLIPNASMGKAIKVAAAVGASTAWNDDLYSSTASFTLPATNSVTKTSLPSFSFYPNPAKEVLNIVDAKNSFTSYKIYDLTGKEIIRGQLTESKKISITDIINGTYFIELSSSESVPIRKKFLKN